MKGRQLCGAMGIVIMAVSLYIARDLLRYAQSPGEVVVSSRWEEMGIVVELAGDPDHAGIYFLPEGSTLGHLLQKAGADDVVSFTGSTLAEVVRAGDRVTCDTTRHRVTIGDMSVATRLALDMPIDLNGATREELMLIPGIGPHTAGMIVELRKRRKTFFRVEELEEIPGMGKKRYNGIREHLYVQEPTCS